MDLRPPGRTGEASQNLLGKVVPTREDAPVNPRHPYAMSKYMGELACLHYHQVYGLPVTSLRIFNAYGRGQRSSSYGAMFSVFMRQKLSGAPLTIVGDGSQRRDFVHVSDVCEAFYLAAMSEKCGVWNVGSDNPISVAAIASLIGGETVSIPKRPGEPDYTWADISGIRRDLGWEPKVMLADGVADMLEHIDEWADAPLWTADGIAEQTREWFGVLA